VVNRTRSNRQGKPAEFSDRVEQPADDRDRKAQKKSSEACVLRSSAGGKCRRGDYAGLSSSQRSASIAAYTRTGRSDCLTVDAICNVSGSEHTGMLVLVLPSFVIR